MKVFENSSAKKPHLSYLFGAAALSIVVFTGCKTQKVSEYERFETSIRKEMPFRVDSLRLIDGTDVATFRFGNQEYVSTPPDAIISPDGACHVYRTFVHEPPTRQKEDMVWRNVIVSKKNRRVICIDRYLRESKTQGYIYVMQSESEKYPHYGKYHWDVSDLHNLEMVGTNLANLRGLTMKRLKGGGRFETPTSQDAYWTLIFHADSLFEDGLYGEAKQTYDLAFSEDCYILPSMLSSVANKMQAIGNDLAAIEYLNHRVRMEKDFYMEPENCSYPELKDTFEVRKQTWHYNLPLKERLEGILERDQYDRLIWNQSADRHPEQTRRNEMLRTRAWETDSTNLLMVNEVLSEGGFPRKSQVGEFAAMAVWSVFQHNPLEQQEKFLPQLEDAVRNGDIAPMFLALLKDRIDVRKGRPQKYGTQMGPDGLCPLLDASRVNEWRVEVGLPLIEIAEPNKQ